MQQQFDPSYSSIFFDEIRRWKFGSAIFWSIVFLFGQILVWNSSFYIIGGSSKGSTFNLNTLLYITVFIISRVGLLFYQYQLSTVKISDNKKSSLSVEHPRGRTAQQTRNRHIILFSDVISVLLLRWIDPSHIVYIVMQALWGLLTSVAFMQIVSPSNYSEDLSSLFVRCNSVSGTVQYTCINEQYLMVLCYGIFNGIIYGSIYLINREYQLHFPSILQSRWVRFRSTIGSTLYRLFKISLITIPLFYLLYIPLSAQLFNYCLSFLTRIGIDSTYTLESISQVDIVTTVRLFLISCFLGASFYFPNHIFEIIHTQLFQLENNGTSYLLDALSNVSSPFILYLAYLDLHYLSHWSGQRRSYFYGDTTGDSWKRLLNLVCDRVDSISTSIYKIKQKKDLIYNNNNQLTSGSLGSLQRKLDNILKKNQVESPLEDLQLYIWAIESISTMVCTSIKEDRYGVVQNCETIPTLLNSLLSCLSAVEDYLNSPINLIDSTNNSRIEGYQLVRQPALVLVSVLNNSIYMIVTCFYENLSYFKLPPKHALKLQQFVNFKE